MTAAATLAEIDRIHDDEPERAAAGLRALDASALPPDQLPLLAFLTLHVLGEKLGAWEEAADRLERLGGARPDAPLAVVAHAAAAAHLAGQSGAPALAALAAASSEAEAGLLTALAALGWRPPADTTVMARELMRLADESASIDASGPLNQRLAVAFNNTTSRLLELAQASGDPVLRDALLAGSAAALRFWTSAGTWVNRERALYLCALVHNRIGDPASARADCLQALDLIAANGDEAVDRAFLQLQLAGALFRLGVAADAQRYLEAARNAAATWDDAALKAWFDDEHDRLFVRGEQRA